MRILSPSGTNFIFIGNTAPTSNVGPWLKNGTQWWVWDPTTKAYAPQDISASFTPAFVMGHSIPATTNPPVWLQTTLDATSVNPTFFGEMIRWFVFDGVNWLSPHPVPPNCPEGRIWLGTEQSLWAYDGGDGTNPAINAPTANTGAMWQVETLFQFRFPLGVGTNTIGFDGNVPSAVALLEQGGDERVAPTADTMFPHTHAVTRDNINVAGGGTAVLQPVGFTPANVEQTTSVGGGKTSQNMPPFVGVFFIKRTTRIYYTP